MSGITPISRRRRSLALALLALVLGPGLAVAAGPGPEQAEFFEREIRPLLAEHCVSCHGGKKTRGGLKLTSRAAILAGGNTRPAAVPGKPDESLLIQAVRRTGDLKMPPKKKLSDRDVARLVLWIEMGLPWPETPTVATRTGTDDPFTPEQHRFWSFQPVRVVPPPPVKDRAWPRTEIDRYVLAALEARGLHPAPPADRRTLLRRVTFDLTGLPPTPAEVDAFLADRAPDAYARVVDRLLASPAYGERWGRHWLDVVRYTDSFDARILSGSGNIMDIPASYRYRDWVVEALNRDLPYDQFVINQIAGDLLPPPHPGQVNVPGIVATGMLAIGNWGGGDADKDKLLTDIVDDQIDVVCRGFLGLTMACARCHDHKFDPLLTDDYYGLAGIFFSTHILEDPGPKTNGPPMLRIPLLTPAQLAHRKEQEARLAVLEKEVKHQTAAPGAKAPPPAGLERLNAELADLKKQLATPVPFAHGVQEGGCPKSPQAGIHDVRIHIRGRYDRLGKLVPRHFPRILAGANQPPIAKGSGRLQLARWIASRDNPLTARVLVNRVWQHHFGEGLVRTPGNFGKLGEPPTNPPLLDYLAHLLVERGWSLKALHREILLSAVYRQSSITPEEAVRADPDNRLLGRMNRQRLEAEAIRDSLLAVAGRLDRTLGGKATQDFNTDRRTLYYMTIRSDRTSFRELFDAADPTAIIDKRTVSTVAPQALFLLNHPFALEQAKALARRILREGPVDDRGKVERLYVLLFGRPPGDEELRIGLAALAHDRRTEAADKAWEEYCQVLLCTNEFIYVD
jgi:mono/diheme cytochrome c family protein